MTKLVRNEQTRLMANFFNHISVTAVSIGIVTPIIQILQGEPVPPLSGWVILGSGLPFGVLMHFVGRTLLRQLED
jgi:hypothetical protein